VPHLCVGYGGDASRLAVEDAAQRLAKAGHTVRDIDLPPPFGELPLTREIINDFERARGMAHEWQAHREEISEGLAKSIRNGLAMPRDRYTGALRRVEGCRRLLGEVFSDVDVLLTPTVQGEAPLGLTYTGDHRFQSIWTQLGTPAVTLPTHAGPNGMPVGIQLVAARYLDDRLLAIAQLVFRHLGRGPVVKI
jgi:Asp-tRNA(Asn)/Glu-tRNA(Gln) amidotransferase A subunit family amidase